MHPGPRLQGGSRRCCPAGRCGCGGYLDPRGLLEPRLGDTERVVVEVLRAGGVFDMLQLAVLAAQRLLCESQKGVLKILGAMGRRLGIEAGGIGAGLIREGLEGDLATGAVYPHGVHLHPAEVRIQLLAGADLVQDTEALGRHELLDGLFRRACLALAYEVEGKVRAE